LQLGDVIRFGNGKAIKPGGDGPYPVYGSNGIIGGCDEFRYENGVIIGRVGAYCGSVAYCPTKFWASDNTLVAFPASAQTDTRFLFYLLTDAKLSRYAGGAAQPLVTQTVLKQVEVRVPPLPVQRRIVGILSAYDELMENSQRRIRILEAMARALYREWFVDFRYPGHEKVPLAESELGPIPSTWRVARIGEEFRTVLGGTPSRANRAFWDGGTIPWINSGAVNALRIVSPSEFITELALEKSAAKLMPRGTTVLAITGATLGQVSYLEIETSANQSVVGIVGDEGARREWLFLTVKEHIGEIIMAASGGAQQHINKDIVNGVQIGVPPKPVLEDFSSRVRPTFELIASLLARAINLRSTRDLLLPRLLSGQLSVEPAA
jgi:type I restriction enzyme S subunit